MVLWFNAYTASLGHDFMTLRAFPGFHNPMALWFCGSMVPRPRSSRGLARTGFHDLLGILKPFLSTAPAPWRLWTRNFVGLLDITGAIYHKSLGDVLSMVTEICRIVPKWSPTPVPPPPLPGLTFSHFRDFSDFFAHRPCPLVSFDLKLCVIVGHH